MARLSDIFVHCNDINEMRVFYSEVLKLHETFFSEKYKHLVYDIVENPKTSLVLMQSREDIPYHEAWDKGPVFQDGEGHRISFSVREDDFETYKIGVERILSTDNHFQEHPIWVGYWSFMVKDPMGNTIDYYHEPDVKPEEEPSWGI